MRREVARDRDHEPVPAHDRLFGEGHRQATVTAVMGRGQQVTARRLAQQVQERTLAVQLQRRGTARDHAEHHVRELRPAQLGERLSQDAYRQPRAREPGRHAQAVVLQQTEHADHRRRPDRRVARLVIEAHVASGDGGVERQARVAHPTDRLRELPHHDRPLGVAEVHAVRDRERPRTGRRDVARRLCHRVRGPQVRVQMTEPPLAIARQRQPLQRPGDPDHGGVRSDGRDGLSLDERVVLLEDPPLAGHVG